MLQLERAEPIAATATEPQQEEEFNGHTRVWTHPLLNRSLQWSSQPKAITVFTQFGGQK